MTETRQSNHSEGAPHWLDDENLSNEEALARFETLLFPVQVVSPYEKESSEG